MFTLFVSLKYVPENIIGLLDKSIHLSIKNFLLHYFKDARTGTKGATKLCNARAKMTCVLAKLNEFFRKCLEIDLYIHKLS